ncbi:SDR family oxidoreductase [Lacticaseibacillus parahuelsenbergensis]|uniref:SDR family oxidoreductase n=1 Tax=Lacticaseibacillus parahuelsenbergensis TaxID=3068305 RepID=A0ABY9L3Y6_9LACO|nr:MULTISPECIES: SDR family oxidoreductase [Lacticaseibacillus]MDE3281496.1 SDR family oxidoreductase [Lacticaseibacillus casei]WLV78414.1 SDR family oxidoreductase [Lacticaseibacillus sp. NCIMB 15471]
MDLGLKGKNAIVTGGATGLGQQFVLGFAREGVNVAFTYMSEKEEPEETVAKVKEISDVKAVPILTNLADPDQITDFFNQALKALGSIDIVINDAGIWLSGKIADIPVKDWDLTMQVNLRAPFLLSQAFVNYATKANKGGHIVNVTSQAAYHGSTTGHAHYAASKAGLIAFSISLAREVAKQGINVNNVAVGIMHTRMIQANLDKDPQYYLNRIPVGRVAEPSEIANIGIWLASAPASYMTGATIDATGGMLMH